MTEHCSWLLRKILTLLLLSHHAGILDKVQKLMNVLSSTLPQVSDVTMRLRDLQPYWVSLPGLLCSDRVATGTGAEDKCWNGMNRAR